MTMTERLHAMELLWKALSASPEKLDSPAWHGEVLAERLARVEEGKAEYLTTAELKTRLKRP